MYNFSGNFEFDLGKHTKNKLARLAPIAICIIIVIFILFLIFILIPAT